MIRVLRSFYKWLFPANYAYTAICQACGEEMVRERMVYRGGYGYFCDEAEADEYWARNQV
jgi:hypothetical protein